LMNVDECWWMLMNVDECWWMLMNVDECWWMLMNVDETIDKFVNLSCKSFQICLSKRELWYLTGELWYLTGELWCIKDSKSFFLCKFNLGTSILV
jgi:hypothetical protein